MGKSPETHSHVHQQQVDGLLHFAERMKWSYINETRDYAEDAYAKLRSGDATPIHLHDWLFNDDAAREVDVLQHYDRADPLYPIHF